MKLISMDLATLDHCVREAQLERVVITRKGKPIALIVGVEGMDEEQLQLGVSDKFWRLIVERRAQKTMSRAELEQKAGLKTNSNLRSIQPTTLGRTRHGSSQLP